MVTLDEAAKQRKIIYQLEKERDRYINEASELTQKVLQNMEDVKVREMQIFDFKKKIAESETRLKQQQNLYEACRADRNLYSKNLIEAQGQCLKSSARPERIFRPNRPGKILRPARGNFKLKSARFP